MRQLLRRFGFLGLLVLSGGCLSTHQGLKKRATKSKVAQPAKSDRRNPPRTWRRVGVGFKPKVTLAGFIRVDRELIKGDEYRKTFWVFDKELNKTGFYFETGLTFRINTKGEYKRVGIFDPESCVLKILRLEGPINYYAMTPPEGSPTPFFDELNPPKTPAPKKAEGSGDGEGDS